MAKISVRFYGDHEVRALWDEENSKWWFSVVDVVGAMNGEENHLKNRNYWKYLKGKLRKEGNELVSVTNQFKLTAADDKCVDRSHVGKKEYLQAMRTSGANISLGSSFHCRDNPPLL